jgi:hypothetical protein
VRRDPTRPGLGSTAGADEAAEVALWPRILAFMGRLDG